MKRKKKRSARKNLLDLVAVAAFLLELTEFGLQLWDRLRPRSRAVPFPDTDASCGNKRVRAGRTT